MEKGLKKNYIIEVRATKEEKETLEQKARALNLKLSTFLRFAGLNMKIEIS